MSQQHLSYRPDIDGLRAFSILAVLVYHAFPSLLPGGFVGVDIFFVISGYLITRIILESFERGEFSLAGFYRRRVQRILPPLIPVLLFCLGFGYFALLPAEYAQLGEHTAAASTFVPNLLFWTEAGYFDNDSKLKPLLHLWSLGVEEQFYLVWPLTLLLMGRVGIKAGMLILALLPVSFSLGVLLTDDRAATFFLPHFRAWELLLGALLAWLQTRGKLEPLGAAAAIPGILLLVLAVTLIDKNSVFPGWWALLPTSGAALVIAAGASNSVNRALGAAPLVFLGKISFALYLWHWPLLSFARIMEGGEPSALIRSAAVTLALLLAWASYRWLETPLRYRTGRLTPWAIAGTLLAVGALGLAIAIAKGLPERTTELNPVAENFYWKEHDLHERDDCSRKFGTPGRCLSDGKPPTIAVIGDSHSSNTFFALAHRYRDSTTGVMRLGEGGCPPLHDTAIQDNHNADICLAINNAFIHWVAKTESVETVYLSSLGAMYVNPGQTRFALSSLQAPTLKRNRDVFARGLAESIRRLLASGKHVVVVVDWPSLNFDPRNCVDTRPLRLTAFAPSACTIPLARHRQRSKVYRQVLAQALAEVGEGNVEVWDTHQAFCNDRTCTAMRGNLVLYRDRSHLSMGGSEYLGEQLQLKPAAAFKARLGEP
ncbi:acyltransferase [Halioglobus maricola]|uniref:Acyltransferase n=1 Tax=Halioglobus maricola TaxID=2601894 RepID=A0A5P9NFX6_9GAMM|nr:acyltransferase family protein [Halioglobus maricola]QFU74713.1 acyltransferase [Halioglobus maricola]